MISLPPHGRSLLAAAASAMLLLGGAAGASAQEGCEFGEGTRLYVRSGLVSHVSTPHFVCADGVEIWADSAVAYSDLGMSHLMGSVRYRDRTRELRADTARYFSDQARLQATGHVFIRNESDGSQIENGVLVYLRRADFRDEESMSVTTGPDGVRPRALVAAARRDAAADGAGASPPEREEPYAVVGDRIDLRGDDYFRSVGNVEILRDSLRAYGDSVEFDQADDRLVLEGSARILSRGSELVGRTIVMDGPGSDSSRIHAREDALLLGDGVRMTSPQIVVFLVEGALDRLVATPLAKAPTSGATPAAPPGAPPPDSARYARPVATLDDAVLTADSLEILAPGERVDRVVAVGRARSVSTARDSLNVESLPEVARSDWLEGDTVIVTFRQPVDSAALPAGDEAQEEEQEIESVSAHGAASALYRLTPSDTTAQAGVDPPALHYVVGQVITITMAAGDVEDLHVVGQTRGAHLEPLARRAASDTLPGAPADTSGLGSDASRAVVDTLRARPDTVPARPDPAVVPPDTRPVAVPAIRSGPAAARTRASGPIGTIRGASLGEEAIFREIRGGSDENPPRPSPPPGPEEDEPWNRT